MSKLRKGFRVLEGGAGLQINGVGGMEVAEVRGFVGGVVDGLRYVLLSCPSCGMRIGSLLLTTSLTERSAAQEKRPGGNVMLRSGRMDLAAVLTLTRMTMICNYNVQFPFRSPEAISLAFLLLWLHGYNAMNRARSLSASVDPA